MKRLPLILLWCKCQNLRNELFIQGEIQWCVLWATYHLMLAVCPRFLFYVWLCSWMIWFVSCKARHWRIARLMVVLFPFSLFKQIYFANGEQNFQYAWELHILSGNVYKPCLFLLIHANLIWLKLKQILADCVLLTSTTVSSEAKKFVDVSI